MATFVLIPGACHGGWWFEPLARRLRNLGHDAYAVTLTGLGDRRHAAGRVNLDTHVEDVLALLEMEEIEEAILCAHRYGGMVATGVADRAPARIDSLVYVDAHVPSDGDSTFDLTSDQQRRWFLDGSRGDGYSVAPQPFFDPRATTHPPPSLLQEIRLQGDLERFRRRDFIYLSGWEGSSFTATYERLKDHPAWNVHVLPIGHNFMRDDPEAVLEIILATLPR